MYYNYMNFVSLLNGLCFDIMDIKVTCTETIQACDKFENVNILNIF